jgi:hypothetical protein
MSSHTVTVVGYVLVALLAVSAEIAAARGVLDVQPVRVVAARISRTRSGRIGVMAAWAWLGMHFFAR